MASILSGKKIAILATDGVEQMELTGPRDALESAGAKTELISPKPDRIKAWKFKEWGDDLKVDKTVDQAHPQDYDALLLPGGVMNPDHRQRPLYLRCRSRRRRRWPQERSKPVLKFPVAAGA